MRSNDAFRAYKTEKDVVQEAPRTSVHVVVNVVGLSKGVVCDDAKCIYGDVEFVQMTRLFTKFCFVLVGRARSECKN